MWGMQFSYIKHEIISIGVFEYGELIMKCVEAKIFPKAVQMAAEAKMTAKNY